MRRWVFAILAVLSTGFVSSGAFAEGGADAILNKVGQPQAPQAAPSQMPAQLTGFVSSQLSDPFLVQFFSHWQVQQDLPYDVRAWVTRILNQDYQHAAHLWSAIQRQVPEKFRVASEGAYIYLLWKLGLGQTFFNEWLDKLGQKVFRDSPISLALDQTVAPGFEKWLLDNAVTVSVDQKAILEKMELSRGGHFATLRAWTQLRGGLQGAKTLEMLPMDHPLKVALAQTVALAMARASDLSGAGTVLKQHVEPAIETQKDVRSLSRHYLEVARLLYQAGALDAAADFYQRVPTGTDDYLKAREELAWVWLRMGETGKLRGELKSLATGLFENRFAPDVYVVRSISNLKLCYLSEVEKDLKKFVESNRVWAKKIGEALESEEPVATGEDDLFVRLAAQTLKKRTLEQEVLDTLATQSITAVLPAVGPQQHWEKAKTRAIQAKEAAKKQVAAESRRHWKNRSRVLAEAIRKMQFVKVELYSQVRTLAQEQAGSTSDSSAALERDTKQRLQAQTQAMLKQAGSGELIFPFDGVVWPDELFHLTSVAESRCLSKAQVPAGR